MSFIHSIYLILFVQLLDKASTIALNPSDVVIVILDQKDGYHIAHANMLKENILEQADAFDKVRNGRNNFEPSLCSIDEKYSITQVNVCCAGPYLDANQGRVIPRICTSEGEIANVIEDPPNIILSHELHINGSWTIIPLLEHLSDIYTMSKWFFFCLENTVIRLNKLLTILSKFNENENLWIGHALYDHEPTIIHHFAEHNKKFKYPHVASGFALTSTLLTSLVQKITEGGRPKDDFAIDASYEFASFVLKVNKGVRLTHVPQMCIVSSSDCATYPRFFHPCDSSVAPENVYFAVKTCAKFHTDRIPAIKGTWAKYAKNVGYFSDVADKYLPNAFVVPNTTQGHCEKTYNILLQADKILEKKRLSWLIISDDDTIFSVARLLRLLTCYNKNNPLAIGERYGFRLWDTLYGYEYLTGGAGVALSAPLVHQMVRSGRCNCPMPTTPDDMYLFGICLARIGVEPVHSPLFHQARPSDYATAYLASQEPVSFHKFWLIEPKMVYDEWFAEADKSLRANKKHTEL